MEKIDHGNLREISKQAKPGYAIYNVKASTKVDGKVHEASMDYEIPVTWEAILDDPEWGKRKLVEMAFDAWKIKKQQGDVRKAIEALSGNGTQSVRRSRGNVRDVLEIDD